MNQTIAWTALASAFASCVVGGCQPVVTSPITLDSKTNGISASGGGGAGGSESAADCGSGVPESPAVTIADAALDIMSIAVDATDVYWGSSAQVLWKVGKDGGVPVELGKTAIGPGKSPSTRRASTGSTTPASIRCL